jgi:hypothetical protein
MAKCVVSGFAAPPNSSPPRRSDNAVQKIACPSDWVLGANFAGTRPSAGGSSKNVRNEQSVGRRMKATRAAAVATTRRVSFFE